MSAGSRYAIGLVAFLGAIAIFAGVALETIEGLEPLSQRLGQLGLGIFPLSLAVLCFFPGSRAVTARVVAGFVFIACVILLFSDADIANAQNALDFLRAIRGPVIFGLPAFYVLIWGFYPPWGRWGQVLAARREE